MTTTQNSAELAARRHGSALSIQWVGFALQRIIAEADTPLVRQLLGDAKTVGGQSGSPYLELGCVWTQYIIIPFGIELALKALLVKETGNHPDIHDLMKLYSRLQADTRAAIEQDYKNLLDGWKSKPLPQLLEEHKDDFVRWRYLDETDNLSAEDPRLLQLVLSALLDVYNAP